MLCFVALRRYCVFTHSEARPSTGAVGSMAGTETLKATDSREAQRRCSWEEFAWNAKYVTGEKAGRACQA